VLDGIRSECLVFIFLILFASVEALFILYILSLLYAFCRFFYAFLCSLFFWQAKAVLLEVIKLAPNLPDSYHTLGLVCSSLQDYKRAMSFYLIAAHLTPKDASLWKRIFTWSM